MKPITLRLDRLETRLAPAVATWDGGGANANWTTAANWVGDVTPNPGDDLVFPPGAARLGNVNDFPDGTAFRSLTVNPARQQEYQLSGNRIALAAGLSVRGDSIFVRIVLPITLSADQAFATEIFANYLLTGPVDLNGHNLTFVRSGQIAGDISGTGSVTFAAGGYLVLGHNTYTGPTVISPGSSLGVDGSIAGPVTFQGDFLRGRGSVGDLTMTSGRLNNAVFNAQLTLTTGNLTLSDAVGVTLGLSATDSERIAVVGSVNIAGTLQPRVDLGFPPLPGQQLTLIDNDGTDPVVGTFAGLAEGAAVTFDGVAFHISYHGGDGNDVVVTVGPEVPGTYAVGAGPGGLPTVNVYDGNNQLIKSFVAYATNFQGGVRVATADVTRDGVPDIITAPGPGGGPHIRVFDGVTFEVVKEFMAYDPLFTGGIFVAAARMNAQDANAEIITGARAGGGPHVKVFDGATGATGPSFFAYDGAFRGGVSVAGADYYTNFRGDTASGHIVTGPGPGGGGDIRVFDGTTGAVTIGFFIYDAAFRGGVNVAAIGPLYTGDDITDGAIVTAPASGGTVVNVFYRSVSPNLGFQAYDASFLGGVTVAVQAFSAEGTVTVLTGTGPGGSPQIKGWQVAIPTGKTTLGGSIFAFDPAFLGGVFVG